MPLVRPTVILLYKLRSWPVPISKNDNCYNCKGHDPVVCETGPLWNSECITCIRGILQSGKNLGACALSIQFRNKTIISHLAVKMYVISTWVVDVVIRCQGKAAVQSRLTRGVHSLKIAQKCSVENDHWTLTPIATHKVDATVSTIPFSRTSALNLSSLMPPLVSNLIESRPENDIADGPSISLDSYKTP
jgi:hypothetical protein